MLQYDVLENMVVITGATKDEINVIIPTNIEGKQVCQIKDNAFSNNNVIQSITIPGTVKVIGAYAFSSCNKLKRVDLEEGVETIEDWAFISSPIESIELPKSIRNIGSNAFLGTPIRKSIEDFVNHSSLKKPKFKTNNKCAVLPAILLGDKESLTNEYINGKSKYIDSQFELVDKGELSIRDLDLPILFDRDEILIALYNKKPLEDITIELSSESKTSIGNYLESDSNYLILKFNIYTKGQFISSFLVKTLYLENAELIINNIDTFNNKDYYYYFITTTCNLECYGTGALNKQFSFNLFEDLLGKYESQERNKIIKHENYLNILDLVTKKKRNIIDGFISQLAGCPYFIYLYKILNSFKDDPDYNIEENNIEFNNYLDQIYNTLSDFNSLLALAFDTDSLEGYLKEKSNLEINDLANKYKIDLVNDNNESITIEEAKALKEAFINNEENYKFYNEMLDYTLKELRRLNRNISLISYNE